MAFVSHVHVAPLVGAWIEIYADKSDVDLPNVAPLVGAWIEITSLILNTALTSVAPLVGAWIEILCSSLFLIRLHCRSSCRSVD